MARKLLWLIVLLLLLTGCSSQNSLPDSTGNGSINSYIIAGKVLTQNEAPIAKARVTILDQTYITDNNGYFQTAPLTIEKTITLTVSAPGYLTRTCYLAPDGEDIYVFIKMEPNSNTATVSGKINLLPSSADAVKTSYIPPEQVRTMPLQTTPVEYNSREILIRWQPGTSTRSNTWQGKPLTPVKKTDIFRVTFRDREEMEKLITLIQQDPAVELAEPNYPVYAQGSVSDPYYYRQWNLEMIHIPQAWSVTKGSRNVKVAILDSGVVPDHPDLMGNIAGGYDFVDEDPSPADQNTSFSHGTHVAGIIGAVTNNSRGIAGINWNVTMLPVKVIGDDGTGNIEDLIQGIKYAADQGADIINMSLGTPYYSEFLHEAVKYAYERGVILIAAAGNNGNGAVLYPARFSEVIAVGSVGPVDNEDKINLAYYSNYGPEIDVVAPGGDASIPVQYRQILSTGGYYENGEYHRLYQEAQGTSMATPHVAGVAALLVSQGVSSPERVRQLLRTTARDLGDPGFDNYFGYGLVDAYAALQSEPPGEPRVFAGVETNGRINLYSEITTAVAGSYTLREVKPGQVEIYGWVDMDNNGQVSAGDYWGKYEEPLAIQAGDSITGIDFSIQPINSAPAISINF